MLFSKSKDFLKAGMTSGWKAYLITSILFHFLALTHTIKICIENIAEYMIAFHFANNCTMFISLEWAVLDISRCPIHCWMQNLGKMNQHILTEHDKFNYNIFLIWGTKYTAFVTWNINIVFYVQIPCVLDLRKYWIISKLLFALIIIKYDLFHTLFDGIPHYIY